jgi:hypothetical protein
VYQRRPCCFQFVLLSDISYPEELQIPFDLMEQDWYDSNIFLKGMESSWSTDYRNDCADYDHER